SKSNKNAQSRAERKKQSKNKNKNKKTLWKKILLGVFGVILAIGVGGLGLFAYYASSAPELTNDDLTGSYSSDFVDMNGDVFYTLGGDKREYAEAQEYPELMLESIKAIEDTRFNDHLGIDPIGISRAALGYLTNAGEIVGGGSTITQQLVKLAVFSTEKADQTLKRKAQEAWLAIQLERQLSKEQIMTLYLNRIHMGSNVYGVATAAEEYYGKHVGDLELHEAAMFAAMPKAPNYYNPYVEPEAAKKRRDLVLDEMVEYGSISQDTADESKEIPVEEGLLERKEDDKALVFDAYVSEVIEEIDKKTDYDPYTAGLTIHTNYDPNAQKLLYDVVNSDEYVNFPNDELQTAVTLVDSTSGKLTALIGGRKAEGQRLLNRATKNSRSVGSTIKPLSTYGPAIEFNQYSTYHQVIDEKYSIDGYSPRNYDRIFKGQMSIRESLVDSRNVPTAKIFNEDLDHNQVEGFLEGLGVDVSKLSGGDGLVRSSAINGAMTPLELTGAYSAFANEGNYTEPYAVTKIVNQQGDETDLTPDTNKAMQDYTAYMVTDILKGVIPHYGNQLSIPGYVHAAKTGTSNYSEEEIAEHSIPSGAVPDNWVVGYSPYYTMAVWMGYDRKFDEGNQLKSSDGSIRLARAVYKATMSRLVSNLERRDWQRPSSVVELSIEKGSMPAKLAPEGSENSVSELFVKGSSEIPTETAEPAYELTAPTGLTAKYDPEEDRANISW
ncbi:MAG: transglycosylase domain-containing protein, partial [Atopostipes suicloacalis]|nr:transglycosylase domain-containing protein [Atopostipes suicloacalis]